MPESTKINAIRSEFARARNNCSTDALSLEAQTSIRSKCSQNGYQQQLISTACQPTRRTKKDLSYISFVKIPFISDTFNRRLSTILRKTGLPARIVNTGNPEIISRINVPFSPPLRQCKKRPCPINDTKLCFAHHVVYQCTCICGAVYIGSTTRYLHDRMSQHMKCNNSAIFLHKQECGTLSSFTTTILSKHRTELDTRINEALHIQRNAPSLNRRCERDDVLAFISNYESS